MRSFFGILSFVLAIGATVPYIIDILKGRVKLARATRILFFLLMIVTLIVQSRDFTSWVLLFTVAEVALQVVLFALSFKYGVGGLARLDKLCYAAFTVSLISYLLTQNAALSLSLLILTDSISFIPTIVKNWRDPTSDTWVFFVIGGMVASTASFLSRDTNSYSEIVFPIYIFFANLAAVLPVILHIRRAKKLSK